MIITVPINIDKVSDEEAIKIAMGVGFNEPSEYWSAVYKLKKLREENDNSIKDINIIKIYERLVEQEREPYAKVAREWLIRKYEG